MTGVSQDSFWSVGMRRRKPRRGATKHIIQRASAAPGGIIRWSEAEGWYQEIAPQRSHWAGWKMNISRIFKRYFVQVEGVRGHYMLRTAGLPSELDDAV